jgi:lipoprotein-anchoring transpeptidase ErfK/SrfK
VAPQGFFGSALDANVVAPVRVRGEIVRTDLYPASWARPIASLGAALITTIIAVGHFGSAAPAKAQDGYGTLFGYDDHAAERLQQRDSRRTARHSRAPSSDHQANTAEKTSAPQEAVDPIVPLADQHVANIAVKARQSAPSAEATAPRDAGEPILAIVSIKSQRVTFYDADGWILSAPVSTGTKGRETPAGVFAVIEKDVVHHSTLYDDASMPHMQRLTWNGIALHGGPLPGYAASHGCVRMPYGFAKKLFDKTRIGMRVIISPDDATPIEFSHAALLVPNAQAVAAAPERAERLALEAAEAVKMANEKKKSAAKVAREAASSKASLRKLGGLKSAADANLAHAQKAVATAKTDQAKARAEEQKLKAAAKATEAGTKLDTAKADATSKIDAAAKAADAAKEAATRKTDTATAANDAKLALQPVSVYISRATQKLYVRRNTHKPWPDGGEVFDASIEVPVVIRDPDRPIGTHVFTATARNDAGLRWTAVTIDNGDDAKDALDRISIPKEVLDRIAPTALPRSSIIVSDEPLSRETNYRTEFIAVLSNQPQGGFITRRPTISFPRARRKFRNDGGFFSFFGF